MTEGWGSQLRGKSIVITGASSGIGRECARQCACAGAKVLLIGRDAVKLEFTLSALYGDGHKMLLCDLCNPENLRNLATVLAEQFPIHGLLHCAGIQKTSPLRTIDSETFGALLKLNVVAAVDVARILVSPKIFSSEGGSLVFISSIASLHPEKGAIEYAASKAALNSAVGAMASELASRRIRVNAILPAMVQTPMLDAMFATLPESSVATIREKHRLGILSPEDVADLAVFLVSDKSRRITGDAVVLDSGYSLG